MKRDTVRMIVGLSVIATHIIAFLAILFQEYIDTSDRLDVAMLLVPVSAAYVTAIVRSAIATQEVNDEVKRTVNANYVSVIGLITFAFCGALLVLVFGYPKIGGQTLPELRQWLVIIEVGFGGAFGLIAEDLFGRVEQVNISSQDKPKSTSEAVADK
jgi:hypothetical protein